MFEKIANDKRFEIAESLIFHEKVAQFVNEASVEKLADILELTALEYKDEFRKEALDQGYSEEYVQGVFDTSEQLCKTALKIRKPFNLTHTLFGDPAENKATFFNPNRDLAMSTVHGLGGAGLTSMIPGVGPIAAPFVGAHAFAKHRWGPGFATGLTATGLGGAAAAAGAGGYEGYKNFIAPQPGEEDQNAWIGQQGMGGIGGLALGALASNAMGYKGLSSIPLALLGMYGGAKLLPQIASSLKETGSNNYGTTNYGELASKYLNPALQYNIAGAQQGQPGGFQTGMENLPQQ